jgi:hypothetical protein
MTTNTYVYRNGYITGWEYNGAGSITTQGNYGIFQAMTLLCSLSILKSIYFPGFLTMRNDQSTSNALYLYSHYLPNRKVKNLQLFQHTTTVLQQPTHFTVLEIPLKPDCNLAIEKVPGI